MSMEWAFVLVFTVAALATLTLLALAIVRGRQHPTHRWAWVLAVVIAIGGALLNLAVVIGGLVSSSGQVWWLLPATIALLAVTAMVFVRPRWAAWTMAVTAVAVPLLVFLATLVATDPELGRDLLGAIVGFYGVRALVIAALLWWATRPITGSRPPASRSPAPRSESVPTG